MKLLRLAGSFLLLGAILAFSEVSAYSAEEEWQNDQFGNPVYHRYYDTSTDAQGIVIKLLRVEKWKYTYGAGNAILRSDFTFQESKQKNDILEYILSGVEVTTADYARRNRWLIFYQSDGKTKASESSYSYYSSTPALSGSINDSETVYNADGSRTIISTGKSWSPGYAYDRATTTVINSKGHIISDYSTSDVTVNGKKSSDASSKAYTYIYNGNVIVQKTIDESLSISTNGVLGYSYTCRGIDNGILLNKIETWDFYDKNSLLTKNIVTTSLYNYSTRVTTSDTITSTYAYYASKRMSSKALSKADAGGNVRYEYFDENFQSRGYGRISVIFRSDRSFDRILKYRGDTEEVDMKEVYDAGGNLTKTIEYLANGVVREVYREAGRLHFYTYQNGRLIIENDPTIGVKLFNYSDTGAYLGYTRMYVNSIITGLGTRSKEEYDSNNKLIKKYAWDVPFFVGSNLAWLDYGKDIGICHFTGRAQGYSTKREELDAKMRTMAGTVTRVFLLTDLRSGLDIDASGNIIGFDSQSAIDLKELLMSAEANGVSLILTLFDFTIADGTTESVYWNGTTIVHEPLGEFPDFINDPTKRLQLRKAVLKLFADSEMEKYKSVLGFDIFNEPEWMRNGNRVSLANMRSFVNSFKSMLHYYFPDKFVTVGSNNRVNMLSYWADIDDVYQFHYYDNMTGSGYTINFPADQLGLPVNSVIFAGELQPTSILEKLQILYDNGYEGGLFWNDENGMPVTPEQLVLIKNWFYGNIYEYYPDSGKLRSKTLPEADTSGNIRYDYFNEDYQGRSYGRLSKATRTDGSYDLYVEYWVGTEQVKVKEVYDSTGTLIGRYEYDQFGGLLQPAQSGYGDLVGTNTAAGAAFSEKDQYGIYGEMAGAGSGYTAPN